MKLNSNILKYIFPEMKFSMTASFLMQIWVTLVAVTLRHPVALTGTAGCVSLTCWSKRGRR